MRIFRAGLNSTFVKSGMAIRTRRKYTRNNYRKFRFRFEALERRQMLSMTWWVNTKDDVVDPGDNYLSLREAIQVVSQSGDTIKFDTASMNGKTVTLTGGQIEFNKSLIIDAGSLSNGLMIEAVGSNRIFNIATNNTFIPDVRIIGPPVGLTLQNGNVTSIGDSGGAISSAGLLKLDHCIIVGNSALNGGGVYVEVPANGTAIRTVLDITNSTFMNNTASPFGGGTGGAVRVVFSSVASGKDEVHVSNSHFLQQNSAGSGGALFIDGGAGSNRDDKVIISASTFDSQNATSEGGAIFFSTIAGTNLSVQGSTISGNHSGGIGGGLAINVGSDSTIEIQGSFIVNNQSGSDGGGLQAISSGLSSLSITNSQILNNDSGRDGGGIFASTSSPFIPQQLTLVTKVSRSTISGNTTVNRGGGLFAFAGWGLQTLVEDSTFSQNHVQNGTTGQKRNGGGLYAYVDGDSSSTNFKPRFTITGSTIDHNSTNDEGGGIFVCAKHNGEFVALNSTFSDNSSGVAGGGMWIAHFEGAVDSVDAYIRNVTVTQNVSPSGGGIGVNNQTDMRVRIANSIVSQNFSNALKTTANNLAGPVVLAETLNNVIGIGRPPGLDTTTNHFTDSPGLGDLVNNGGITQTRALLTGSPAIDAGSNDLAKNPLTNDVYAYDQRGVGFARKVDAVGINDQAGLVVDIGAYEFAASIIGDYDHDGDVDCWDYSVWRSQYNTVPPASGPNADGNNSGFVDAADYVIWANAYDANFGFPLGDFNHDKSVDVGDYNVWRAAFNTSTGDPNYNMNADANCDGHVDLADYVFWRDRFTSRPGAAKFGLLDAIVGPGAPPEVVGFALLGAVNTTSFDFTVPTGSGEQLRSVPLSSANAISITFSQAVIVSQSALQIINLDGSTPTVTSFAYDSDAQTATWTFATSLADGRYLIRLADSVHNSSNAALDGEFTNPWSLGQTGTSVLPQSGNGTAGGEFRFRFTMMAGDSDHDNIVGATNYQFWKSYEPGRAYVSTTSDDYDSDVSFGDFSLREAINYANLATEPTTIEMPVGHYYLTRSGTESATDTAYNDLDIFGNMKILGAGPGATIIDGGSLVNDDRIFDVANLGVLGVSHATIALGAAPTTSGQRDGGAVRVKDGGQFDLDYSAVVGNATTRAGNGGAIYFAATGHGSITNSVITVNVADNDCGGVYLKAASSAGTGGAVSMSNTIVVNNTDGPNTAPDVYAGTYRTFTSGGHNRLGNAATGFTNGVNGDYIKPTGTTVAYVVTSVVDSYDGSTDPVDLSLRDAISLANATAGTQEIWLPAWDFVLTRQRTTAANLPELSVSQGDIEITDSLIIRGISGSVAGTAATSVKWMTGAVADKVFELVGDYNGTNNVDTSDYNWWQSQVGHPSSTLPADGDDDGDVDTDDYNLWLQNNGHTLVVSDISVTGNGCG